ncbi:MAG: hypothetical protein EXR91_03110 [Gemmatimonadetes bacterium]|nr:hypothetical protein [Gemmatimonadota bacterium]
MTDDRTARRGPKLLEQVRRCARSRHFSPRTEEAYVAWIRRSVRHHGMRHPAAMGTDEAAAFLSHLANERSVSVSTRVRFPGLPFHSAPRFPRALAIPPAPEERLASARRSSLFLLVRRGAAGV